MNSLYKISEEYLIILRELEENGGDLTEELAERLKITSKDLEVKCTNYVYIMQALEVQMAFAQAELKRIEEFKNMKLKQYDKLKEALLQAVLLFGKEDKLSPKQIAEGKIPVKRLEFDTLRLSTKRSSSVEITDETKVQDEFKYSSLSVTKLSKENLEKLLTAIRDITKTHENITSKTEPSKTKIEEGIKGGKEVDGAYIKTNYGLTIK